jgi:hypothetical protein
VYTECTEPSEPCEEIICDECIKYCGPTVQIRTDEAEFIDPKRILSINQDEPLAETLQKLLLWIQDKDCAGQDDPDGHAPYYVYTSSIAQLQFQVNWTGETQAVIAPVAPVTYEVSLSDDGGTTYVVQGSVAPGVGSFVITGLAAANNYVVAVEMVGADASRCMSVQVHVTTLL